MTTDTKAIVNLDIHGPTISRHIYGQFAENLGRGVYGGFYVGEDSHIPNDQGIRLDVVEALKALNIPNLRWPGGCFGDEYHWRDGIGPKDQRPSMLNTHWGDVEENNHFGTHEFMHLCELLETEPYVSGNVGSGTVEEMSHWVEYLTAGRTRSACSHFQERDGGRPETSSKIKTSQPVSPSVRSSRRRTRGAETTAGSNSRFAASNAYDSTSQLRRLLAAFTNAVRPSANHSREAKPGVNPDL